MKKRALILAASTVVVGLVGSAYGQTWSPTPATGGGAWDVATNWTPNTAFPNVAGATVVVGQNLTAAQTISLNSVTSGTITVGSLTLGDSTTGFFGYTISSGTATGSLTFQASSGNATLTKATGNTATDVFATPVILGSTLDIRPAVTTTAAGAQFLFSNVLTGTASTGVTVKGAQTSNLGTVTFLSKTNTYGGATTVENGTLSIRGSVLNNTPSGLGQASSAIIVGNINTPSNTGAVATLALVADADSGVNANYTIERQIDFSQATIGGGAFAFQGNANTVADAGTVTLAGGLALQGTRNQQISAARAGMTINVTGKITSTATLATAGKLAIGGGSNGTPNSDGAAAPATYRFSDVTNDFVNVINLWNGNVVIAGDVGAIGTASPIGKGGAYSTGTTPSTVGFNLGDGNGGNVLNGFLGASTAGGPAGSVRGVLMEKGGTTFARALVPSGGTGSNYAVYNVTGNPATGTLATSGAGVNVVNGYRFGQTPVGATDLGSEVVWSGTIAFSAQQVGTSNNTVAFTGTNKMLVPGNAALFAATGGTVNFTGQISQQNTTATSGVFTQVSSGVAGNVTGQPSVQGLSSSTRVTINQFRNNEYLDGNADGIADPIAVTPNGFGANEWTGPISQGIVKLSDNPATPGVSNIHAWEGTTDIRGGTLLVNGRLYTAPAGTNSGIGDTVTVWGTNLGGGLTGPGATLGGTGRILVGKPGSVVNVSGTIDPGDPTVAAPTQSVSILTIDKSVNFQAGSTFKVDINGAIPVFSAGGTQKGYDRLSLVNTSAIANSTSTFTPSLTIDQGAQLVVSMGYEPDVGGLQHNIIDLSVSATATGGRFAGLAQNALLNTSFNGTPVSLQISYTGGTNANDVILSTVSPINSYALPGSGTWTQTGSWTNPSAVAYFPNNANQTAVFGSSITGPSTVSLESAVTVASLQFNNTNTYSVNGTAGSIALSARPGQVATLTTTTGDHTINVPVTMTGNTTVTVAAGSFLTLLRGISGGNPSATVNGELTVSGTSNLGVVGSGVAGVLSVVTDNSTGTPLPGVLSVSRIRGGALEIDAGSTVAVTAAGTAAGTSVLSALAIAPGGTLNLRDNDLILAGGGVAGETALRALVAGWYQNGTFAGTSGLISSTAAAGDGLTTLAVTINDKPAGGGAIFATTFNGLNVGTSDVLVKYTYIGDTNLDGLVTTDDLANLIRGIRNGYTGWFNGDTNYDGVVNGLDYANLIAALNFNGAQLGDSGGVGGGAGGGQIPEPSALGLMLLGLPMLGRGSRRRR